MPFFVDTDRQPVIYSPLYVFSSDNQGMGTDLTLISGVEGKFITIYSIHTLVDQFNLPGKLMLKFGNLRFMGLDVRRDHYQQFIFNESPMRQPVAGQSLTIENFASGTVYRVLLIRYALED